MSPKRDPLPLLQVADRAQLRSWLSANGATSSGVRLAIGKKGRSATSLTYDEAVEEALAFGWIDSTAGRLDDDRYTVMFVPRKPTSTWARTNKARVERLIAEGRMTPAGLAVIEIAKANGSWNSIDLVEDLVMPEELAAALAENPDAQCFWDELPAGQRKLTFRWIASAKREETRSRRIAQAVQAAAEHRRLW